MARRGGFFGWIADQVEKVIDRVTSTVDVFTEGSTSTRSPGDDYSGGGGYGADAGGGEGDYGPTQSDDYGYTGITDSSDPPGQQQFTDFDFQLAGFQEQGLDHKDYVNLEGEDVYLSYVPWADLDYFVIQVNPAGGDPYYVTIVGPFDDYDDFLSHIHEWYEQGS